MTNPRALTAWVTTLLLVGAGSTALAASKDDSRIRMQAPAVSPYKQQTAPADITISLFRVTSAQPLNAGQRFNIQFRLRNTGRTPLNQRSFSVRFYYSRDNRVSEDDLNLGTLALPEGTIPPGGVYPERANYRGGISLRSDVPEGSGYILMVADPFNRIAESDENNNLFVNAVTVRRPPPPDLDISLFRLSSSSPLHAGQRATVQLRLRNQGEAAINLNDVDLRVYYSRDNRVSADDYLLAVVSLPAGSFAAGTVYPETTNLSLEIPVRSYLPSGAGNLLAVADVENRVEEANEGNNLFVIPVTIQR